MLATARNVRQLVDAQVMRWSMFGPSEKVAVRWPVITVSREYGSQGAELGKLLADRLGFDYWDKGLVSAIIEESGAWDKLVTALDETALSGLHDLVNNLLLGATGSQAEYLRQLVQLVSTIDRHGAAVIIGRGAEFIVRSDALRLRVIAPEATRAQNYADRCGGDLEQAVKIVRQHDRERRKFIRTQFRRDVNDVSIYDIVLNSGQLSMEDAVGAVLGAYRVRVGGLPDRPTVSAAPPL